MVSEVQTRAIAELRTRLGDFFARVDTWVHKAARKPEVVALARLLAAAEFYIELQRDAPHLTRIIAFSLSLRVWLDDDNANSLLPGLFEAFGPLAQVVHAAQDCKALDEGDPVRRAILLFSAGQGFAQTAKLSRFAGDVFAMDWYCRELVRTALRGWGADPKLLARAERIARSLERQPSSEDA